MSANHFDIIEKLSAYLDGELTTVEMAEVKNHLASCADCMVIYERLKSLDQIADDAMPVIGDEVLDQLEQRITKEIAGLPESSSESKPKPHKASVTPIWQKYTAIAASLLIITLAGRMALKESDHALDPKLKAPSMNIKDQGATITDDADELSQPAEKKLDNRQSIREESGPAISKPIMEEEETKAIESLESDKLSQGNKELPLGKPKSISVMGDVGKEDAVDEVRGSSNKPKPEQSGSGATVEVRDSRKGMDFNATGTVSTKTQKLNQSAPVASVDDILSKEAGILAEDSNSSESALHIRGGRSGEMTYLFDGVNDSNSLDGNSPVDKVETETANILTIDSLNRIYAGLFELSISDVARDIPDRYGIQSLSVDLGKKGAQKKSSSVSRPDFVIDSLSNLDDLNDEDNLERYYLIQKLYVDHYKKMGADNYRTVYKSARTQSLEILMRLMSGGDYHENLNDYLLEIEKFPQELK